MGRLRLIHSAIAVAGLSTACATVGGLQNAEGDGDESYYRGDVESVFDASVIALSDLGLTIARLDPAGGYVAAEAGGGMWSYGEVVGVYVRRTESDPDVCRVEVVSRKRMATNLLAKNWEDDVLEQIDAQLTSDARMIGSHAKIPPPAISRGELHDCLQQAARAGLVIDQRARDREVRECRNEGAGDASLTSACLRRREAARRVNSEPDLEVLNACLQSAKRDYP